MDIDFAHTHTFESCVLLSLPTSGILSRMRDTVIELPVPFEPGNMVQINAHEQKCTVQYLVQLPKQ